MPFEHTFVWIVDADDPHRLEEFALEAGLASFNSLAIVPLKTLAGGCAPAGQGRPRALMFLEAVI